MSPIKSNQFNLNRPTLVNKMHADMRRGDCDNKKVLCICDLSVTLPSPHAFFKDFQFIFIVIKTNSIILHEPIIHNSWGGKV